MPARLARFATAAIDLFFIVLVVTFVVLTMSVQWQQQVQIEDLRHQSDRQQRQIDQNKRQIGQLNGRVFLGVDIPDTLSGRQP